VETPITTMDDMNLVRMLTLHLLLMSSLAMAVWPLHAAMCRADKRSSMKFTSAP